MITEFKTKAKQLAKEILEGKKVLLTFPRGFGKTTFAKFLQKNYLNNQ